MKTPVLPIVVVAMIATFTWAKCDAQNQDHANDNRQPGKELHPIAAGVESQLADPSAPFTLAVMMTAKRDRVDDLIAAYRRAATETLNEAGNLQYSMNRSVENDKLKFLLFERWRSVADLDLHLKQEYTARFLADFEELLAQPPAVTVMIPINK